MLQETYQTIATTGINVIGLFLIGWFIKREIARYDQKHTLIGNLSEKIIELDSKTKQQEQDLEELQERIQGIKEISSQQEILSSRLAEIDNLVPKINGIIVEFQLLKKDIELVSKLQKPLFAMRDQIVAIREKMDDFSKKE